MDNFGMFTFSVFVAQNPQFLGGVTNLKKSGKVFTSKWRILKRVGFALKSFLTNPFPKTAKQKIDFPQRTYQNDCWPNETFVFSI